MTANRRLLGRLVLAMWALSLLTWLYVVFRVLTEGCVTGGCRFDFYAPLINGIPLLNFLTLSLAAFVLSFVFMTMYLTFWWRSGAYRLARRFARGLLLAASLHSFLLFSYLVLRVVINQAPINSPFIDIFLPWLTFLRLAAFALVISVFSLVAYLLFFRSREPQSAVQGAQ